MSLQHSFLTLSTDGDTALLWRRNEQVVGLDCVTFDKTPMSYSGLDNFTVELDDS